MMTRTITHSEVKNTISFDLNFLFLGLFLLLINQHLFAQCEMMIDQNFNHWNNKEYTVADAKSDFNNKIKPWTASTYRGISAPGAAANLIGDVAQETRIVDGALRAEYTKDDAGGYAGGFLFDPYFDGVEEAYLEYKVKFDDNFFWATGGKLPGLGGSTSGIDSETTGRGTIPSGCKYNTNGWSARLMWRRNRAQTDTPYLILYSYFAERQNGDMREDGDCGDGKRIFTGLNDNTWYTVRQYIKMNTPGQKDGTVVMWINGVETYRDTQAMIRNAGKSNLKINALIMNTYRGGSRTDPVWHSPRDEYAFFDDFKVWTGCSNPPGEINQDPTGWFVEPMLDKIQESYSSLYVRVNTDDADGDSVDVTLKIDGTEIRTEKSSPFEWGHVSAGTDFTFETVGLSIGDHFLEAVIVDERGGRNTISKTITVIEQKEPYSGVPILIPGELQAENYDKGGEGISYHDTHTENKGGLYRGDAVDIDDGNNGWVVGWISTGEWLEYTVLVDEAGDYDLDFYTSSLNGAGELSIDLNGNEILAPVSIPSTGSWDVYGSFTSSVSLSAGEAVLRINIKSGGFNLDKIMFRPTVITGSGDQFLIRSDISVYPNPSNGIVYLSRQASWELYTIYGVAIARGNGRLVDLSSYPNNTYILKTEKNNSLIIKK